MKRRRFSKSSADGFVLLPGLIYLDGLNMIDILLLASRSIEQETGGVLIMNNCTLSPPTVRHVYCSWLWNSLNLSQPQSNQSHRGAGTTRVTHRPTVALLCCLVSHRIRWLYTKIILAFKKCQLFIYFWLCDDIFISVAWPEKSLQHSCQKTSIWKPREADDLLLWQSRAQFVSPCAERLYLHWQKHFT